MCNPVAIGLVVAGTALQVNAQRQRAKNMQNAAEDARLAEVMRQQRLSNQREAELSAAESNADLVTQQQKLDEAAAKREAGYAGDTTMPNEVDKATDYSPTTTASDAPKVVSSDAEARRSESNALVDQLGNARARMQAFGDLNLGNSILNRRVGDQIGMLANFSRASSQLLPGEVQAAQAKHSRDKFGQEMLGTALQLYGSAGAPGVGGAGTYGAAMGSANAGATIGGYSGNLSNFAAGPAGSVGAAGASPSLTGGLLSNWLGQSAPSWLSSSQQGLGSLLPVTSFAQRSR
ncbi:hypothetical protein IB275_30495 [Pseudomonas sp. PDM21]|uniref:hypothetical protein n=1 Tax=Pseudomonas sp. PDM21 TaxID=2769257 RepID=UPI00177B5517|nr:hypothetical protein [Pseudomonas sp. PDM21]MBD9674946.1 hypothetical protein [Pseudomonas sp. PDM21]